jgi:hypothetical protein
VHPPRNANTLLQKDDIDITIVSTVVKSSFCTEIGLAARGKRRGMRLRGWEGEGRERERKGKGSILQPGYLELFSFLQRKVRGRVNSS